MGEELEPIIFSITNQDDLKRIGEFKTKHLRSCRAKYPDFTGAMFKYTAIPTGLGSLYIVQCPCGEKIALYGDMN